jgi:murein DD-endopeptidase MepM/ murein hydrolase activator NlpD
MTCLARGDSRLLIRSIQLFRAEIGLCQLVLFDPLCEVLAVPEGTIIYASASGEVNFVGEQQDHGMVLILDHPNNYHTVYGHLSEVLVHSGQSVEAGQPIAESGETGICSEPCLYFEVRNGELPLDPMRYLP